MKYLLPLFFLLPVISAAQVVTQRTNQTTNRTEFYVRNSPGNTVGNSRVVLEFVDSTKLSFVIDSFFFPKMAFRSDVAPYRFLGIDASGNLLASSVAAGSGIGPGDTAAMLTNYVRRQELIDSAVAIRSAFPSVPSITGKLNISDTAAMLIPYLRKIDTTAMLAPYLLSSVAAATYATISNLALKVNISDTSAMLSPYLRSSVAAATYQPIGSYLTGNQTINFTPTGDVTGSASGATSLTPNLVIGAGKVTNTMLAGSIDATKINSGSVDNTEFGYLDGVTSGIQGQINAKEAALTFSTGLTRAVNTITNNLSTGVGGGQTAIGGTGVGDALSLQGTTGNGTGTVAAIKALVGNNGATTAMSFYNSGVVHVGNPAYNAAVGLNVQLIGNSKRDGYRQYANNLTTYLSSGYGGISSPASLDLEGLGGINFLGGSSVTYGSMTNAGKWFLGANTTSTAWLQLAAGTTSASTAPLKFTSGTNMTTAEAGAVEWNGTNLFVTQTSGPTRKTIAYTTDIPASPTGYLTVKRTADTTSASTTLANLGNLFFPVTTGVYHYFKFVIIYQAAATTTGIKLALTFPAVTVQGASVQIFGFAADGSTTEPWAGTINSSGDVVISTGVVAANVNYVATIEGMILPSSSGNLVVQWASEAAANCTLKQGSIGYLWTQ